MEFRKNDLVTLEIEDCGIDGEGIGKADGFTRHFPMTSSLYLRQIR